MSTITLRQKSISFLSLLAVLSVSILFNTACSSNQKIFLTNNGSGTAVVTINLDPMLIQYISDITGGFNDETAASRLEIFNIQKIKDQISGMPRILLKHIENPSPGRLTVSLKFSAIDKIFPGKGKSSLPAVFQFTEGKGARSLLFTLTAGNFTAFTTFIGLEGNESIDTFGPQKDHPLSKAEYTDMIEYLFSEYGSKAIIDTALTHSTVTIDVQVQGSLSSVVGSPSVITSFKGSYGTISIPLLDIVTLSKPLTVKIDWH